MAQTFGEKDEPEPKSPEEIVAGFRSECDHIIGVLYSVDEYHQEDDLIHMSFSVRPFGHRRGDKWSFDADFFFCPTCGAHIHNEAESFKQRLDVYNATLE